MPHRDRNYASARVFDHVTPHHKHASGRGAAAGTCTLGLLAGCAWLLLAAGCSSLLPPAQRVKVGYSRGFQGMYGAVPVDGKWGFIDRTGEVRIRPRFDHVAGFNEGLARVGLSAEARGRHARGRIAFITPAGDLAIEPMPLHVGDFSCGRALFVKRDRHGVRRFGYLDKTGFWSIPPAYEAALPFSENRAAVRQGRNWGYIDTEGKMVIRPRYEKAYPFSGGLAQVMIDGRWGYVDRHGKIAVEANLLRAGPFHEGLAAASRSGLFGYIDRTGTFVIRELYAAARPFSEGLAAVQFLNRKWGFIGPQGRTIIRPNYDHAKSFSPAGLAPVNRGTDWTGTVMRLRPRPGGKWGYVNRDGELVIDLQFRHASRFTDGFARVGRTLRLAGIFPVGTRLCYIDTHANTIWKSSRILPPDSD